MARTTIEISKEALHFAAAHFTIFSATERENLHGHNFRVAAEIDAEVGDDGLAFDYNLVKTSLKALCDELDEHTLLPALSPHLAITEEDGYTVARFGEERIPFLARDVLTLPVGNITVEALAQWIATELLADPAVGALDIVSLTVKVSSGPGQWARARIAPGSTDSGSGTAAGARTPEIAHRAGDTHR